LRKFDTGDIGGVVHAFNENGPATVVDDRHDASQMLALGLRLGRRDHLARCRQGQHFFSMNWAAASCVRKTSTPSAKPKAIDIRMISPLLV
jgi:hypothetical protein